MADYEPVDLSQLCNTGPAILGDSRRPPIGEQIFHGLPFRIGDPARPEAPCFVLIRPGETVSVPLGRRAERVVVAHRRLPVGHDDDVTVGQVVAHYTFDVAESGLSPLAIPIRERLEIAVAREEAWDSSGPFLAASSAPIKLPDRYEGRWDELGLRQTEVIIDWVSDYYLWTWQNPHPGSVLDKIEFAAVGAPVLVAAITVGTLAEHPFFREAARTLTFTALDPGGPRPLRDPALDVDRGVASYAFRLPGAGDVTRSLTDPMKGWGEPEDPDSAIAYARIAATGSATVVLKDGESEVGRFRWKELTHDQPVETAGMRVQVAEQGRNWVHVTVLDDATGRPVPCRVAFRSVEGVPYQPHGHHGHVNSDLGTWHIDVGGDVRLGRLSYAYIDGTCQGWLPTGDLVVDVARGFEYEPLREQVRIAAGQRELTLRIRRWTSMNERGWYSGDSHVHFLSAQGALTEQQGEDLNVVNLLQSQWGSLFTSTEEFTGAAVATPDGRHVTWVSQENRQPFFGHLVLWGLQRPVMPWCTDGPNEDELGGWLETTISDWADRCHEQQGTVIIPHFPLPNGEPAVLIATGRADGVEMIVQRRSFHEEYYRYLNCGYRLPLVGGTDKMSADVPVGLYRTYARLGDEPFSYDAWTRAVRAGRTFLSGGPMIDLRVEGHEIGDCVRLSGPGTVHVSARAEGIFPICTLQLIQNGRVVASTDDPSGARRLDLQAGVRVDGNCWLTARCGGPHYFDAPSHHDAWARRVFAHTSPVYVACGADEWSQFDVDQARSMLAVIEGGLQRVRHHAVSYPEDRISHHHGEPDHGAFLERPFAEALERVRERLAANGFATADGHTVAPDTRP
ncbi:MAG TPA: CehA/McbA family metallohydrolase [Streptosporangiaceae bacterium]